MDEGHTATEADHHDWWHTLVTHLDLDREGKGPILEVASFKMQNQKKSGSDIWVDILTGVNEA